MCASQYNNFSIAKKSLKSSFFSHSSIVILSRKRKSHHKKNEHFFAHTAKTLADTCDNSSVDIFSPFVFFRRIHGLGCSHVLAWSTSRWRWKSRTSTIHYKKIWNQRTKNQIGHWYVVFFFNKTDFFFLHKNQFLKTITIIFMLYYRYLPEVIPLFQTPKKHWLFCVSNISSINFNCDAFLGLILDQSWSYKC